MAFQKQKQSTKGVKSDKERRHADQRVQLIQLLAPPPAHLDELRVMAQLNQLSGAVELTKHYNWSPTMIHTGTLVLKMFPFLSFSLCLQPVQNQEISRR